MIESQTILDSVVSVVVMPTIVLLTMHLNKVRRDTGRWNTHAEYEVIPQPAAEPRTAVVPVVRAEWDRD